MYSIQLLEKTIKLAEIKVLEKLNKKLSIKWEIMGNQKIKVIINNEDPIFYINMFELINWISISYNLIEIRDIISRIEPILGDRQQATFNEKMGQLDIKLILNKIEELGHFSIFNGKAIEAFIISLKGGKSCSYSECYSFSKKLIEEIQLMTFKETNIHKHTNLERYGKFLKKVVADLK